MALDDFQLHSFTAANIEPIKAGEDSTYVFNKLHFNTSLPSFHTTSKTKSSAPKRNIEEFYADIPKALIKKIYAKYAGCTILSFIIHIIMYD